MVGQLASTVARFTVELMLLTEECLESSPSHHACHGRACWSSPNHNSIVHQDTSSIMSSRWETEILMERVWKTSDWSPERASDSESETLTFFLRPLPDLVQPDSYDMLQYL
jgi:hypothetical protein